MHNPGVNLQSQRWTADGIAHVRKQVYKNYQKPMAYNRFSKNSPFSPFSPFYRCRPTVEFRGTASGGPKCYGWLKIGIARERNSGRWEGLKGWGSKRRATNVAPALSCSSAHRDGKLGIFKIEYSAEIHRRETFEFGTILKALNLKHHNTGKGTQQVLTAWLQDNLFVNFRLQNAHHLAAVWSWEVPGIAFDRFLSTRKTLQNVEDGWAILKSILYSKPTRKSTTMLPLLFSLYTFESDIQTM